jgi:hypothetical protein
LNNIATWIIAALFLSLASYYFHMAYFLVFGSAIILGVLFASYMPFLYALPS